MAIVVPTLPTDTSQNKRVRTSSHERVDALDFKNIGALLTERMADFFRSVAADEANIVFRGFRTTQDTGSNMFVKVQPESAQNYSSALQAGYLVKETAASVTLAIDSEGTLTDRWDIVSIRAVEDETTPAVRPILSEPTITFVDDEAPGSGTGDGTTALYDLANAGAIGATLVARVGGIPVNAVIVPATGASGKDQIAFAQAPTSGATIRLDYYYLTGGIEQAVSTNTRFTSIVEYVVTKGVANGVEPATPAGYMKIARITGITTTTTAITNAMITKLREFWNGNEAAGLAFTGSLQTIFRAMLLQFLPNPTGGDLGSTALRWDAFLRNVNVNMAAAATAIVARSVNATDDEPIMGWNKRGDSPAAGSVVAAIGPFGQFLRRYKHFNEQWKRRPPNNTGTPSTATADDWNNATPQGTVTITMPANTHELDVATSAATNDVAVLRQWGDLTITAVDGANGQQASEMIYFGGVEVRLPAITTIVVFVGVGITAHGASPFTTGWRVGFVFDSADSANWHGVVRTAGGDYPTGTTRTDLGVPASTDRIFLEIYQRSATIFDFHVDGVLVGSVTATPQSTNDVGQMLYHRTRTTAARSVRYKDVNWGTGRWLDVV